MKTANTPDCLHHTRSTQKASVHNKPQQSKQDLLRKSEESGTKWMLSGEEEGNHTQYDYINMVYNTALALCKEQYLAVELTILTLQQVSDEDNVVPQEKPVKTRLLTQLRKNYLRLS